jgi:phosphoenolpyruvate synthase/pyruvate phosphate dikinase
MKPINVKKKNEGMLLKTVYKCKYIPVKQKYKVGDKVRINKSKGIFEKGYIPNWSTGIFKITQVIHSNPIIYRIKDIKNDEVEGMIYEHELQKTKYSDIYLVEKKLRRKGDKVYVKWLGFANSRNSWIDKVM